MLYLINMTIMLYLGASAMASQAMMAGPQKNRIVRLGPNLEKRVFFFNFLFRHLMMFCMKHHLEKRVFFSSISVQTFNDVLHEAPPSSTETTEQSTKKLAKINTTCWKKKHLQEKSEF